MQAGKDRFHLTFYLHEWEEDNVLVLITPAPLKPVGLVIYDPVPPVSLKVLIHKN